MSKYRTVQLTGTELEAYIAQRLKKPAPISNYRPAPASGIIEKVNLSEFRRAFADYNRADNFSYDGLTALFDWLEQLADDTDTPYVLDVIALCCEFTEYVDFAEIQATYSSTELNDIEDLQDHTFVIEFDGGIIIADF
tara:strand:- start:46 stop:459 length:414 start_codon:yes stop_codon:yes gene_type:complete